MYGSQQQYIIGQAEQWLLVNTHYSTLAVSYSGVPASAVCMLVPQDGSHSYLLSRIVHMAPSVQPPY
jgi:hypothetical protein